MNHNVANVLPLDARDRLVQAAATRREERAEKIDQAIGEVKRLYPQFFQKEQ